MTTSTREPVALDLDAPSGLWCVDREAFARLTPVVTAARLAAFGCVNEYGAGGVTYEVEPDGTATVTIKGPLTTRYDEWTAAVGGVSQFGLRIALSRAADDPNVRRVMLAIGETHGGQLAGLDATLRTLAALVERKETLALIGEHCGGLGYLLAAPAAWIVAMPHATIGPLDLAYATDDLTDCGDVKYCGFRDPDPREAAELEHVQTDLVRWLARTRPTRCGAVLQLLQGRTYTAELAEAVGLVDWLAGNPGDNRKDANE